MSSVLSLEGRKQERLNSGMADAITDRTFNAVMCGTLLWGFLVNAFMVAYLAEPIMSFVAGMRPLFFWIGYAVLGFAGILLAQLSDKPAVSFLGFNLLVAPMGVFLCLIVPSMPAAIVSKALLLTGLVTATMILLGMIRPQLFLGLGRTLFVALLAGVVVELVATFLFHYYGSAFDWLFVIIFSGYIGFDIARSQAYPKTVDNAIDCALDIYLDIINLFIRILSILSRRD